MLLSSQSTEVEKVIQADEVNDEDVMVSFIGL